MRPFESLGIQLVSKGCITGLMKVLSRLCGLNSFAKSVKKTLYILKWWVLWPMSSISLQMIEGFWSFHFVTFLSHVCAGAHPELHFSTLRLFSVLFQNTDNLTFFESIFTLRNIQWYTRMILLLIQFEGKFTC